MIFRFNKSCYQSSVHRCVQTSKRCWWDRLFLGLSSNMSTWLTPACLQPYVLMPKRQKHTYDLHLQKLTALVVWIKGTAFRTFCAKKNVYVIGFYEKIRHTFNSHYTLQSIYLKSLFYVLNCNDFDVWRSGRRDFTLLTQRSLVYYFNLMYVNYFQDKIQSFCFVWVEVVNHSANRKDIPDNFFNVGRLAEYASRKIITSPNKDNDIFAFMWMYPTGREILLTGSLLCRFWS